MRTWEQDMEFKDTVRAFTSIHSEYGCDGEEIFPPVNRHVTTRIITVSPGEGGTLEFFSLFPLAQSERFQFIPMEVQLPKKLTENARFSPLTPRQ